MPSNKPTLAVYWAASCGGCEIAIVNLGERFLTLTNHFDLVFCPCLMDTKTKDVEAMPDGGIDVVLFNGAIRTAENAHMAELLRRKAKVLVAFGSCAHEGCIPGLGNLHPVEGFLEGIYDDKPTSDDSAQLPSYESQVPEGTLTLPEFLPRLRTLAEVVDVDYSMPGCPPEDGSIWTVAQVLISGAALPPKGTVLGGGSSTVCKQCPLERKEKKITRFVRHHEIIPDPTHCLLEQGIVCMGVATRDGCGALCPQAGMPCTGCYGVPEGAIDQGARMVAAMGSILDVNAMKGLDDDALKAHIDKAFEGIADMPGMFYKYSVAHSIMKGRQP